MYKEATPWQTGNVAADSVRKDAANLKNARSAAKKDSL
jgi:hypothetical protein